MANFGTLFVLIAVVAVGGFVAFRRYRSTLRYAKGIERGLKMVPMLIHLPPSSDDTEVGSRDVRDVIEEKLSQAESLYNVIATTAKKGFWSKFYGQRHICFEIVAAKGLVHYYVAVPVPLVPVVQQAVLSAYPTARLEETAEHNIFNPTGKLTATVGGEMHLKKEFAYPIATFRETRRDVMQTILNALGTLGEGDGAAIQISLRPAQEGWQKTANNTAAQKKKDKGKQNSLSANSSKALVSALWKPPEAQETKPEDKQLTNLEQQVVDAIEQKTRTSGYETLIRVVASSTTTTRAQSILSNIVASFALFDSPSLNGFNFEPTKNIESFVTSFIFRFFPPELNKDVLNSTELATIFHFPDQKFTPTSQLQRQDSKQVDGPRNIPNEGLLVGYNVFRGAKKEIHLGYEDRRRHTYIIGQTGTGKSQLLENLALQDMLSGNGFAFIDPHGDTVEALISMVPKERTEDVIYFNPGDMEYPLGLNLFEFETPEQKDFLIQETINMLYKLYDPQHQGIIGPRYEHWFRNAALTLMSDPAGATFIEIPKVFTDKQFMREKLKHVVDPTVLDFWNKEMAQTSDYHKSEVLGWFVSKFGAFMSNEMMRNIIGQSKSAFNLREVMDSKKILLVNLSKGRVGELNSMLLGMIFVMKFQAAAMSRATTDETERTDFSLYVDEFQNFSTDSFATILSEARKYRLNLIVANQFIGQLTEEIRDAVFGNVGTIVSFRSGANDADFLTKQFSPTFDVQDLITLPNFHAVVRLMIQGVPSKPFSMTTIPRLGMINKRLNLALRQLSAAKYGKARKTVESLIFKRLESPVPSIGQTPGAPPNLSSKSFIDEWLAKRKSQVSGPSQNPDPSRPAPLKSNTPAHRTFLESTKSQDSGPLDNSPTEPELVSDSAPAQEPIFHHEKTIQPATPKAPPQPEALTEPIQPSPPSDTVSIENVASLLKQKLTSQQGPSTGTKTEQPKEPQLANKKEVVQKTPEQNPSQLRPGEIFIDEHGVVYQSREDLEA